MWFRFYSSSSLQVPFADSTRAGANIIRSARQPVITQSTKAKLDKIANPFRKLLATLQASSSNSTELGFGIKTTDLAAIGGSSDNFRRILSLEMLNGSQIKRHIIHRVLQMFCRGTNDTGSPEVQAAIWSVKIAVLEQHASLYRHDYVAERKIVEWKDQRRKMLKYLKRISLERYFTCVDRLGLPHDLVTEANWRFPEKPKERAKPKGDSRNATTRSKK